MQATTTTATITTATPKIANKQNNNNLIHNRIKPDGQPDKISWWEFKKKVCIDMESDAKTIY